MNNDYAIFDQPRVLSLLFHPRSESGYQGQDDSFHELLIPVDKNVAIGGRAYIQSSDAPNMLFFHGNGEIAADYHDLGPIYNSLNINFIPVDYRGYGKSTGSPTVSAMMADCHGVYRFVRDWLREQNQSGPFLVMGRSLGSASVLELVYRHGEEIDALIVESGFAFALPLMRLLGIDTDSLGIKEEAGFNNLNKIASYDKPTLVIHAENDHIIPFSDGEALYDSSHSADKHFLKIPVANHNTIFSYGLQEYLSAVVKITQTVKEKRR